MLEHAVGVCGLIDNPTEHLVRRKTFQDFYGCICVPATAAIRSIRDGAAFLR